MIRQQKTKISLILAMIMMFICFGTACHATPEESVVIGKGNNLNELIQPTQQGTFNDDSVIQSDGTLYTRLKAPKHWSHETTVLNDKLNITADADIDLPNVSQLPAVTASLSEFTQEDLAKILNVFGVSEGVTWTECNRFTKEDIEQIILENKAILAKGTDEADPNNTNDRSIERAKENLEAYEQEYVDAPYESELKKIEFKIGALDDTLIGFEGTTRVDEQPVFFSAYGAYGYNGVNRVYANYGTGKTPFGEVKVDAPDGVALTKEQAAEQAREIAAKLTSDLSLCHIAPATTGPRNETSRTWGWACVFMREINGCPTAYETTEIGYSLDAVSMPATYEKMIIVMDDAGIASFSWDTPMSVESVDNPNVSLLSFPEISQRAIEQISQRFTDVVIEDIVDGIDWGDPGCTANIVDVKLGLSRIAKESSPDYYYLPVWKFFVELEHTDGYYERVGMESPGNDEYIDENGYPSNINFEYSQGLGLNVVTLNALDGSVVDETIGY